MAYIKLRFSMSILLRAGKSHNPPQQTKCRKNSTKSDPRTNITKILRFREKVNLPGGKTGKRLVAGQRKPGMAPLAPAGFPAKTSAKGLALLQVGNPRRAAPTAGDRAQADLSARSQKSGCPMKLAPSALKHHRTPSDFSAPFAGIRTALIKAVYAALRGIQTQLPRNPR